MPQAYRQGRLDGLCGVYSLINAKRLLFPKTSKEDCVELFQECMNWLDKRSLLAEVIVDGMRINTLIGLSRDVIEPGTPGLYRSRPFYRRNVSLDTYWNEIAEGLASGKAAVLICMESWDWSHWSIVWGSTEHQLKLFDSSGRRCVFRRHCSLTDIDKDTPTFLYQHHTLIYKRND